jgi:hypothetical protein
MLNGVQSPPLRHLINKNQQRRYVIESKIWVWLRPAVSKVVQGQGQRMLSCWETIQPSQNMHRKATNKQE